MNKNCPFCQRPGAEISGGTPEELRGWERPSNPLFPMPRPLLSVHCSACGNPDIDEELAERVARSEIDDNRHILSAAIREKSEAGMAVRFSSLDELQELWDSVILPEGPLDRIDKILSYVQKKSRTADAGTSIHPDYEAPIAYAKSQSEFEYLLSKAVELNYLEYAGENIARQFKQYRLGVEGWKRLKELRATQVESNQPFLVDGREYMELAIEEAKKSRGEDDRNHPLVGAVVLKEGKLLATAFRGETGPGNHAEFGALEKKLGQKVLSGATVYTTLEPCTSRRHPKVSCAQRLLERGVSRVVIGMLDPNPRISGKGVRLLRSAKIITELFPHDLMGVIEEINRDFMRDHPADLSEPVVQNPG